MQTSDEILLRDARRGKEAAFIELYARYRTPIFRFACRMTGSAPAAEDITQECFLALLAGASFEASRGPLRTYLFGIVRNLALRSLRLSVREIDEPEDAPSTYDLATDLLTAERAALVAGAIADLPVLQREALILFEYEELSLEEIAAVTGVDSGAVKARLHRARQALRRRLAPLLAACAERTN